MPDDDENQLISDFARREANAQRNIWLGLILFSAIWTGLLVWWLN